MEVMMRILTWNVQWFRGMDGRVDVARVLAHPRDWGQCPEVLCLQEVAQHMPGLAGAGECDQLAAVAAALPEYELFFAAAVDDWRVGRSTRQRFGNLIATRLPVWQVRHQSLPYPADPAVPSMPRVLAAVTVQAPWGPLRVGCTHLAYYSAVQRLAQARALVAWQREAAAVADAPPRADVEPANTPFQARVQARDAILCGDFNAAPGSDAYRALVEPDETGAAAFVDAWGLAHGAQPQPPTFRVDEPGETPIACDFIFITPELARHVRAVRLDSDTRLSDHQPLLLELAAPTRL
ncbi:MAG: endonuclease/exonuclease/phosphatase family protein [Tepidimonas sp.]|uniref:endonuclease/exonuclease/phosphatase family protein n=1 Tax=Tepidimonas sp. TaxID=2002775 RepID=UPI0040550B40